MLRQETLIGSQLVLKKWLWKFRSLSGYPKCKYILPVAKDDDKEENNNIDESLLVKARDSPIVNNGLLSIPQFVVSYLESSC